MGLGQLTVGIPGLRAVTLSVDPPGIGAGAAANVDVTAPVDASDQVVGWNAPDALEAGLVPVSVSVPAAGTIRIRLYNPTAAAVDGAARSWTFHVREG